MKVLALFVGLVVAATSAQAAPKALKPPPELLVSLTIGNDASLDGARSFAGMVKPGAGLILTGNMIRAQLAQLIGATSLDGFDPDAGITLLVSDEAKPGGGTIGVAVLGKVRDLKKVSDGSGAAFAKVQAGWALLGPKDVVGKVAPFAFGQLAAQPAPTMPTATAYAPNVLAHYKPQIDAARAAMHAQLTATSPGSSTFFDAYVDGFLSVLADTDRAVIALDLTKDLAAVDLALVPRPGTRLAQFVAVQHPSDYALLAKLPAGAPAMVFAGHFDSGPYHAGMIDAMASLFGGSRAAPLMAAIDAGMKAANGELAMAVDFKAATGMTFVELVGLADDRAASAAFDKAFAALRAGFTNDHLGIKTTLSLLPPIAYDGVSIPGVRTSVDASGATAAQAKAVAAFSPTGTHDARLAVFDHLLVTTQGNDAAVTQAIDAVHGKATYKPAPAIAALFASSRAHRDSVAMILDLGGFNGIFGSPPNPMMAKLGAILFGFGTSDGNAHVRFAMPAAAIAAMASAGSP